MATKKKAATKKIGTFEGLDVIQASIVIPGLAGGLRDALAVDPIVARKGDRLIVVAECIVDEIGFPAVKGTENLLQRQHKLSIDVGTVLRSDGEGVESIREMLTDAAEAQKVARDAQEGIHPLEFGDGDEGGE